MAFKSDVLKASLSALLAAMLLGAATYFLAVQIAPRPIATLDSYTEKGGFGPIVASNFYFSDQNVTLFAIVKDASNNPIADAAVKFEICGPPNSNITIVETVKTNSSGVAVAKIPAPYNWGAPEKVLGIWSTVAATQIADTQILDSLAFEIKAPPSPFIDFYTDRGGKGPNNFSGPYHLSETVRLYAEVSNGTDPAVGQIVTFSVYDPNQNIAFLASGVSNATGIAEVSPPPFVIPAQPTSIGTWQVTATVKINDQLFIDASIFECKP